MVAESNDGNNTCSNTVTVLSYPITHNPAFVPACDIDIALVLDASASITDPQVVRDAVSGLLTLLNGTNTRLAIVEFAITADTPIPYTNVTTSTINTVFNPYLSPNFADPGAQYFDGRVGAFGTNWDDALRQVDVLTPPDLVMFFTDGEPNTINGGGGGGATLAQALQAAAAQANIIKGEGTHIFGVGVGTVTELSFEYITDGAASHRYPDETTDLTDADYFVGAWSELQTGLTAVLLSACGGTINVTKLIDADGNLGTTGDQTPAAGWEFSVALTGNATTTSPQNTNGSGVATFDVDLGGDSSTTASITETLQGGYNFGSAVCTGSEQQRHSGHKLRNRSGVRSPEMS